MLKKVVLALAVAVVGFVALVASRPSTFRVERSLTMAAPAELPFGLVNSFGNWRHWSPWEKLDPAMKKTLDGPFAGPGAIYAWSGNDKAGQGKMTILESQLYERIRIQLEFIKPWQATNLTTFTFEPAPEGVTVRWVMEGQNTFMGKAFSLFMDMDGMIGKDFENGLATMKSLVEPEAKKRAEMKARQEAAAQPTAPQAGTTTP
jgi:hypothetical protein